MGCVWDHRASGLCYSRCLRIDQTVSLASSVLRLSQDCGRCSLIYGANLTEIGPGRIGRIFLNTCELTRHGQYREFIYSIKKELHDVIQCNRSDMKQRKSKKMDKIRDDQENACNKWYIHNTVHQKCVWDRETEAAFLFPFEMHKFK